MKIQIKSRWDEKVLFEGDFSSIRTAVEQAVKEGAYLRGAYLRGAYLRGAYLEGAYLRGAYLNWDSHALLGEILFRASSQDVEKRMVAGLISISIDWCWDRFLTIQHPQQKWALEELAKWGTEKSPVPEALTKALAALQNTVSQVSQAPAAS